MRAPWSPAVSRGGRVAAAAVLLVWIGAGVPGPGVRPVRASLPAASAWEALDLLDPRGIPAPGFWMEGGARSREALAGEFEVRVATGREPERGPGLAVARTLALVEGGTGGARSEVQFILRSEATRAAAALAVDAWGEDRRTEVEWSLRRAIGGPWVGGVDLGLFPGEPRLAPEIRLSLALSRGEWMGLLESGPGPGPGAVSVWLALRAPGRGTWFAGIREGSPGIGVRWRWSGLVLQVREERHPWLGRESRVRLRWGGNSR